MTLTSLAIPARPRRSGYAGIAAIGVVLLANLTVLAVYGADVDPVLYRWMPICSEWAAAALVWLAVRRAPSRRPAVVFAAAAVTALVLGDTARRLLPEDTGTTVTPSLANASYLVFYILLMAVFTVLARRSFQGRAWPGLLTSAVGALGAASVLAVLLGPTMDSALEAPFSLPVLLSMAFPVLDLLLIATLAGIAVSPTRVLGRADLLLAGGLLLFATTDVIFAQHLRRDGVAVDSTLDAARAIGFTLVMVWVLVSARDRDRPSSAVASRPDSSWDAAAAVAAPLLATAASLAVLLLSSQTHVPVLAVVLAGLTLALATVPLAFRGRLLHVLSRTDELTGLPNRRALTTDVSHRLGAADARPSALLVLDLDRFKEVNDSLGHEAGDRLIEAISARLAGALQSGDLLARLGGDEFAVHLHHADQSRASAMARRLRSVTARPIEIDGLSLEISLSIGIALAPEHGSDLSALLRQAEIAMYAAKAARVGQRVYSPGDDSKDEARLRTLHELRLALAEGQLSLHYQPKVDLPTNTVSGVEALVRWNHPTRGLLFPAEFLDVAEHGAQMRTLTRVVLELALDQAVLWQDQGRSLTISVNLSSRSLSDYQLVGVVSKMLASRGLPGSALMFEITEEALLVDRERAKNILAGLRTLGVQIAVDDFGTGYSSLAYLRDLPIDELKLDQSFVIPMLDDSRAAALLASSIQLGHSLGLRIVAEGVESAEVLHQLTDFGCDLAQGYHLCRPIPAPELESWLDDRTPAAARTTP